MKAKPTGIESIAIRRAVITDSDKVRYRVYRTPTDFIAVIAESALMAVKVSGISKPHKIVRDLPTEGIAIEAQKMAGIDPAALRVSLPTEKTQSEKQLMAEMGAERNREQEKVESFKAMGIADLQRKGGTRARILPPEMLMEIIEQHTKTHMPAAAPPELAEDAAPAVQQPAPEPMVEAPPPVVEPELTPEEKLLQMANDTLAPAASEAHALPGDALTPEDVARLLNE